MARLLAALDRASVTMAVAALCYLGFLALRLERAGCDPSRFVQAGTLLCDPSKTPPGLKVVGGAGYDGQFYYRLALDPFAFKRKLFGMRLDNPPYRHQRILYPLIVHVLSGGNPRAALWLMVGVNAAAALAVGWLAGALARSSGRHALWGLAIALFPGFLFTLSRDLTELVEATLLLGALLLARRDRPGAGAGLLALAALARETALGVAVGAGLALVLSRLRREPQDPRRWLLFAVPILVYAAWALVLTANWNRSPYREASGKILTYPLNGVRKFLEAVPPAGDTPRQAARRRWHVALAGFLGASLLLAALQARRSSAPPSEKAAWLLFAILAVCGNTYIQDDWAFVRLFTECHLLGVLVAISGKSALRWPLLAGTAAAWGAAVVLFGLRMGGVLWNP